MAKLTSRRGSPGPGKDNSKKRESANRRLVSGRPTPTATVKIQQQARRLARALTWGRLFPCYLGHPGPAASSARALASMLEPDPLGVGDLRCPPGRSNGPFGRTV